LSDRQDHGNLRRKKPNRRCGALQKAMTPVSETARTSGDDADRNLALLAYGLLFFAIFFAGAPALIAVAIAYTRKAKVPRLIRSHHRFQIFIFWTGLALTLLAALSGLAAVVTALVTIVGAAMHSGWNAQAFIVHPMHLGKVMAVFTTAAVLLGIVTGLWLMASSAYGFIRLASHRSIRQTAR
jgi:uncharacterized membrane protein